MWLALLFVFLAPACGRDASQTSCEPLGRGIYSASYVERSGDCGPRGNEELVWDPDPTNRGEFDGCAGPVMRQVTPDFCQQRVSFDGCDGYSGGLLLYNLGNAELQGKLSVTGDNYHSVYDVTATYSRALL